MEYHHLFELPKIVYPVIAREPRFYLDQNGFYINDKLFLIPKADYYLLAVLNSKATFFYLAHKLSQLLGGNLELRAVHLQHLPIPVIPRTTQEPQLSQLLEEAKGLYGQEKFPEVLAWAEAELAMGRKDTVADLLAFLAQEMGRLQAERLSLEREWQAWVEHHFQGAGKLGKEWLREGWVHEGLREGYGAIRERFRARGVRAGPGILAQLERHTQETLEALRPLHHRLEATDRLIDRLVARLYGLTEEEAERLWAAPSP